MASDDKIEKISKVDKAVKANPTIQVEELQRLAPNREHFDNLMTESQKTEKTAEERATFDTTKKNSLMEEVRDLSSKTENLKVTPTELIAQAEQAQNRIDSIKTRLSEPNAKIRDSYVPLLQNKLSHINDNIRIILSHSGLENATPGTGIPPAPPIAADNPIIRFLGFLTDGQYRLQTLSSEVEKWNLNKVDINPATMLAMQIKVNFISQELEFFSSLLNKALESTKTIMNVQV